ncbi:MAG: cation:proton antiporter [Bacteroidaceae bacterium]|nr:cation:proton antiporter [Bacteroidaceae bacterium]
MSTLITDLSLILICAAVMTLLFKWLKQPVVLGYIVAGFIAGPHLALTPSVVDTENVETWAEIGVIFLLFALGLEFSFKKLFRVGSSAVITALTIIFGMIITGVGVGAAFGWSRMDCLFLGGMVAMSSTTIIFKAFGDLGLRQKQFAQLVLSVLILEDILAIVLMVILSTLAATGNFEGGELIWGITKMVFFLVIWIVTGIFLIPTLLRRTRSLMSDETQLVSALGLCFAMVILASKVGFSPAFGAFIMGSILAETVEAERIEHLVAPVKDLFGAIFFVSVGMMVDPQMIATYWLPITAITLTVIIGQSFFGTMGVLLAGRPLKTAVQSGLSLTQIGEFAFIIASLGVSLKVTSDFLYPVVVAVSVITTFLTPFMMRAAEPVYALLERTLPQRVLDFMNHSAGARTMNEEHRWHSILSAIVKAVVIHLVVCIAILLVCHNYLEPFIVKLLPGEWGTVVSVGITMLCLSPFLRSIIVARTGSEEFMSLWNESRTHSAKLIATIVLRVMLVVLFVMYALSLTFTLSVGMLVGIAVLVVLVLIYSKRIRKQSNIIERSFMRNLTSRERAAEMRGEKKPDYEGRLLSHDLHLVDYTLPPLSRWAGRTLMELGFGKKIGVHVVSILRGDMRHNIPGGDMRLYPNDRLQVIGTDEQMARFDEALNGSLMPQGETHDPTTLRCLKIGSGTPLLGKTVINCRSREDYHCLIVGIERDGVELHAPAPNEVFAEGDVLWLVGEPRDVYKLVKGS